MISILPIQPDILQMMAEDTGLTAEGPVWGYFAAEGTKMLGYVVVEKAEPVIGNVETRDVPYGCCAGRCIPFTRRAARTMPLRAKCPCRCRWPIPAGERAAWRPFLWGNAPEIQEKSKKTSCVFPVGMLS